MESSLEMHLNHRIECLEAEIRKNRQAMRILATAVLDDDQKMVEIAKAVIDLLDSTE